MKIKVDFDLCDSNGLCESLAPDVFELDDNDFLVVRQEEIGDDQLDQVRRAVAACPKLAIALIED
jgi:ferredoxin